MHDLEEEDVLAVKLCEQPQALSLVSVQPPQQLLNGRLDVEDILCADVRVTRIPAPVTLSMMW